MCIWFVGDENVCVDDFGIGVFPHSRPIDDVKDVENVFSYVNALCVYDISLPGFPIILPTVVLGGSVSGNCMV